MKKRLLIVLSIPLMIVADQHQLVTQHLNHIRENIMKFSHDDISDSIKELQLRAIINQCDDRQLLEQLKMNVEQEILFHQERLDKRVNSEVLTLSVLWIGVAILGATLPYAVYKLWRKPYLDEFAAISKELKTRCNATIKEEGWPFNMIFVETPYGLSQVENDYASESAKKLAELRNKSRRVAFNVEAVAAAPSITSALIALNYFYEGFCPHHKEYHEKFCIMRDQIDKILQVLKK